MLTINGTPAIHYAVAEGFSVGIQKIVIIINHGKGIVRQYFEDPRFRETVFPKAACSWQG